MSSPAPVKIAKIQAFVYRVPLERFVVTSFGTMRDRPAVYLRIEDTDGAYGWGEIWCNWPACGAEHRARLAIEDMAELVFPETFAAPGELIEMLVRKTAVKVLQTDERGPFQQAMAGFDMAMFDLAARKASKPLHDLLAPGSGSRLKAYASGIHIKDAPAMIPACRDAGHKTFKVKIGFDPAGDAATLGGLAATLAADERLLVDANQSWTLDQARAFIDALDGAAPGWFEEPMRVDTAGEHWRELADAAPMPLAGGENFTTREMFIDAIASGAYGIIQPDVAKWGGVSGCFAIGLKARQDGRTYCPHFLGGAIGLFASAHLLAAVGGDGMLEIDANDNPLREAVTTAPIRVENGHLELDATPGLGAEPDSAAIADFETWRGEASA